jgi:hypothetical protein
LSGSRTNSARVIREKERNSSAVVGHLERSDTEDERPPRFIIH